MLKQTILIRIYYWRMKVSRKAYYGLRAVLALAQSAKALSIHTLATSENLPEDYLEKILQNLRRAEIVKAKKGTTGGYILARAKQEICVWDVLYALDGPMKIFSPTKGDLPCLHVSHCQTNQVWRTLEKEIEKTLSNITIEQLTPRNTKAQMTNSKSNPKSK